MKRTQNKIAESRRTLPIAVLYSVAIWLLAGLIREQWWIQFACYVLSVYLMVQLNNQNMLIRIYSRMVSVSYILLFSAAVFLFPSTEGAIVQACFIASLTTLYSCYQDKESMGWTYYTFLLLGIGSFADIHLLFFVPVFWLIMATTVYSLCWRTFFASLLGVLTPYWFWIPWIFWQGGTGITTAIDHFSPLTALHPSLTSLTLSTQQIVTASVLLLLGGIGFIHFLRHSFQDKIRTRQLYYSFVIISIFASILFILLPQQHEMLTRILIIAVSPLIGHFLTLTNTKVTNIAFFVILGGILLLTAANLWISSSLS